MDLRINPENLRICDFKKFACPSLFIPYVDIRVLQKDTVRSHQGVTKRYRT
jgi:hypothetical protein